MGHFFCARCTALADSHDGCDEVNGRLVCYSCAAEIEQQREVEAEERADLKAEMARRGIE